MTRQILVGGIPIGGGAPVVIQSMLNRNPFLSTGSNSNLNNPIQFVFEDVVSFLDVF